MAVGDRVEGARADHAHHADSRSRRAVGPAARSVAPAARPYQSVASPYGGTGPARTRRPGRRPGPGVRAPLPPAAPGASQPWSAAQPAPAELVVADRVGRIGEDEVARRRRSGPAAQHALDPVGCTSRAPGRPDRRDVLPDHLRRARRRTRPAARRPRRGTAPRGRPRPSPRTGRAPPRRASAAADRGTVANRPSLVRSLVGLVARPGGDGQPAAARGPGDDPRHPVRPSPGTRPAPRRAARRSPRPAPAARPAPGRRRPVPSASCRAWPISSSSSSSVSSFRLDLRPAWAAPSTSPSRRCSRSSLDSAKPSRVAATASSRSRAGARRAPR